MPNFDANGFDEFEDKMFNDKSDDTDFDEGINDEWNDEDMEYANDDYERFNSPEFDFAIHEAVNRAIKKHLK